MDTLAAGSLDWALDHVLKFGDTDIFPVPFEFEAVRHGWNWLRNELEQVNLVTYRVNSIQRVLVPKPEGGFRVATQLDPIDTLIFTALIYEAADAIERSRIPIERRIACSYRIGLDASGTFFRPDNGWPDFHTHSSELAQSGDFTHVLLADISDFYSQIYHHRLENALADAGIPEERQKNIASFMSQLTATQSRGIPVGPFASIILAEACLNDVDSFLLRKGYPHVRYVDDFRVFCRSFREAMHVLHDLTEYLYTAHRLSLVPGKTLVRPIEEFLAYELRDPEEEEEEGHQITVDALMDQLRQEASYETETQAEPDSTILSQAIRDNLVDLFRRCATTQPLHLGTARHLLRRAASLRTSILLDLVFDNLDSLTPVLRDVAKYVKAALRASTARRYGGRLERYLTSSSYADIPYVSMWCLEMIRQTPNLLDAPVALQLAEQRQSILGLRPTALLAHAYRQSDWVRAYKETWRNNRDTDRRAIIWTGSILPTDERRHWLGLVQGTSVGVERAIAQKAASR